MCECRVGKWKVRQEGRSEGRTEGGSSRGGGGKGQGSRGEGGTGGTGGTIKGGKEQGGVGLCKFKMVKVEPASFRPPYGWIPQTVMSHKTERRKRRRSQSSPLQPSEACTTFGASTAAPLYTDCRNVMVTATNHHFALIDRTSSTQGKHHTESHPAHIHIPARRKGTVQADYQTISQSR